MENNDQLPADTRSTAGWIRDLPTDFQDVNEGVMNDMMSLTLSYFEEVRIAARRCPDAPSALEMLKLQKRFSLWADGDSDLDRRLSDDPAVRKPILSDLAALVMILRTGIKLFTPEHQRTLIEQTNRVLEQASKIACFHLKQSASCLSRDILAFCNSIKEIESRIDNLYALLPTTRHLVENLDETEPRQAEETGVDEGWSFSDSHLKRVQRLLQDFRRLCSTVKPASKSPSTSQGAKSSRRPHSNPSKSRRNKSYGSTEPSSISPLRSDSGIYDSANPLTDTVTSDPPSEAEKSSSEPTTSSLTRASPRCKKCRTVFSDPAGRETHSCPSYSTTYKCDQLKSRLRARMSRDMVFEPDQFVRILHRSGQYYKEFKIALTDTGADDSFISCSLVEELELETTRIAPTTFTPLTGPTFMASERVQPIWQFHKGSWWHQEFSFFVISKIPGDRDMLLGNIAREELGIYLRTSGTLTAHEDYAGRSTQAQQEQQHERQRRDNNASQAKTRQDIESRHAQMVRIRAAANAASREKPSNPTLRKDATRSDNNQGR